MYCLFAGGPSTQTNHLTVSGQLQNVGTVAPVPWAKAVFAAAGGCCERWGRDVKRCDASTTFPCIWRGKPQPVDHRSPTRGPSCSTCARRSLAGAESGTEPNVGRLAEHRHPAGDNPPGNSIFSIGAFSPPVARH